MCYSIARAQRIQFQGYVRDTYDEESKSEASPAGGRCILNSICGVGALDLRGVTSDILQWFVVVCVPLACKQRQKCVNV